MMVVEVGMASKMICIACRVCGESKLYHETGEVMGHGFRRCARPVIETPTSYRHKGERLAGEAGHLPQPDYVG